VPVEGTHALSGRGHLGVDLATTAWGEPDPAEPRAMSLGLRIAWAQRVLATTPFAEPWAIAAAAMAIAHERWLLDRPFGDTTAHRAATVVGRAAISAVSFESFLAAVPTNGRWALVDVHEPDDLWRAQVRWWKRVDEDGADLLRGPGFSDRVVVGAVLVCAADAWRVRAALSCAAGRDGAVTFDLLA